MDGIAPMLAGFRRLQRNPDDASASMVRNIEPLFVESLDFSANVSTDPLAPLTKPIKSVKVRGADANRYGASKFASGGVAKAPPWAGDADPRWEAAASGFAKAVGACAAAERVSRSPHALLAAREECMAPRRHDARRWS